MLLFFENHKQDTPPTPLGEYGPAPSTDLLSALSLPYRLSQFYCGTYILSITYNGALVRIIQDSLMGQSEIPQATEVCPGRRSSDNETLF